MLNNPAGMARNSPVKRHNINRRRHDLRGNNVGTIGYRHSELILWKPHLYFRASSMACASADALLAKAKAQAERVWKEYKYLADRPF